MAQCRSHSMWRRASVVRLARFYFQEVTSRLAQMLAL